MTANTTWHAGKRFQHRTYYAAHIDVPDQNDYLLAVYRSERYTASGLLLVVGPLVVGYAIAVLTDGRIGQFLGAVSDARPPCS